MNCPPSEAAAALLVDTPGGRGSDCSPPSRVQRTEDQVVCELLELPTTVRPSGETLIACESGNVNGRAPIPVKLISPACAARQSALDAAEAANDLCRLIMRLSL